jgi:hypothetical protein
MIEGTTEPERADSMDSHNPKYLLRNHTNSPHSRRGLRQ